VTKIEEISLNPKKEESYNERERDKERESEKERERET